ncbi:MAG: GatB/YqeY domain-containing protein [Flavobacteriales bacterium]|nr:GatB/YqeY domain-containing protein [Flavobacteriales bacterium]
MSLETQIMSSLKEAMKAKDKVALESLRAIKSEILLAKTAGGNTELSPSDEMKLLQKLVKQRKDAAAIYQGQNRADLAETELSQVAVIEKFLPAQMSSEELSAEIAKIIAQVGASSPADMGKVMGVASKALAGKAEGKAIADTVKALLAK